MHAAKLCDLKFDFLTSERQVKESPLTMNMQLTINMHDKDATRVQNPLKNTRRQLGTAKYIRFTD
jgi:hypothetical protein